MKSQAQLFHVCDGLRWYEGGGVKLWFLRAVGIFGSAVLMTAERTDFVVFAESEVKP